MAQSNKGKASEQNFLFMHELKRLCYHPFIVIKNIFIKSEMLQI